MCSEGFLEGIIEKLPLVVVLDVQDWNDAAVLEAIYAHSQITAKLKVIGEAKFSQIY